MSRDTPRSEYSREDETGRTPYEGEDEGAYRGDERSTLPGFLPFGWPTTFSRGTANDEYPDDRYDEYNEGYEEGYDRDYERADEGGGTWLDEGLITLTIVAGVVLFLFPEPATSGLGILLIAVGVVAWLVDWAM